MRIPWRRRVLIVGPLALCAGAWAGSRALAGGHFGRSAEVAPTAYVLAPTSYVVPTVTTVPTVYASRSYVATSYYLSPSYAYVAPTVYSTLTSAPAYETTRYVVPTASYYVPTTYSYVSSYVPTTYSYVPTVEYLPTVALAADPCATVETAPRAYAAPAGGRSGTGSGNGTGTGSTPSAPGVSSAVRPPSNVDSAPAEGGGGARGETSGAGEATSSRSTAVPPYDPNAPSPPSAPAAEKDAGAVPNTPRSAVPGVGGGNQPGGNAGRPQPPVAPGDEAKPPVVVPPPPEADEVRRQAYRPLIPTPYRRSAQKGNLSVLEGKVISSETRQPEDGVRVTLSNRLGTFADRPVVTDAFGRFAVKLPDGDWTVKVAMPSGRTYTVSQLVVSQGQITDDQGQDIPSLVISR